MLKNKFWWDEYLYFRTDTLAEFDLIKTASIENGAVDVVTSTHWKDGGAGAQRLAQSLAIACEKKSTFKWVKKKYIITLITHGTLYNIFF